MKIKTLLLLLIFICINELFSYPFYEKFYPSGWEDLSLKYYVKNDDDYEWSGPPLLFYKQEWKTQNAKEWEILLLSITSTERYTKWEFPLTTRFGLFPFSLFSYLASKKDNRLLLFTPLYIRKRYYQNDFHFFWLGFYDKEKETSTFCPVYIFCLKEDTNKRANWLFPIYYYSRDKNTNKRFFISILHPFVLPIYVGPMPGSKSYKQEEYWRNWFTLFHFRYKRYPDKETDHYLRYFVFFPFLWIGRDYNETIKDIELNRINFIPLVWYKKNDYFYFIPFYFNQRDNKGNKEFENYVGLFHFSYDSYNKGEKENRYIKKFVFFPFLWIGRDYNETIKDIELNRINFIPLVWYKKNDYFYFIPFYFNQRDNKGNKEFENYVGLFHFSYDGYNKGEKENRYIKKFVFFPFLWIGRDYNETIKDIELNRINFIPLVWYKKNDYFYFIPFYFNQRDNKGNKEFENYVGLFHFSYDGYNKGEKENRYIKKFVFFPFLWIGRDYNETIKDIELNRINFIPLVWYKKNDYFYFIPFYFNQRDNKGNKEFENYVGLFHFGYDGYNKEEKENRYIKKFIFFPFLWIGRDYNESIKDIELNRINFIPLVWYKKNDYFYFIPFYFNQRDNKGNKEFENYVGLFHFSYDGYNKGEKENRYIKKFVFFPFLWIGRDYNETIKDIELNRINFIPLVWYKKNDYFYFIPFYFNQRKDTGEKTFENYLILFSKSYDFTEDNISYTKSYTFLPLIYWKFAPLKQNQSIVYHNGEVETYTRLFISPIYMKYQNKEEKRKWQWFLIYYDWEDLSNSEENTAQIFVQKTRVLSSNSHNSSEELKYSKNSKGSLLFPLWYYKNYEPLNKDINHKLIVSPVYFQFTNSKEEKHYLWSLLYYEWKTPDSNGVVWFPIRLKYQDKRKDFDLWLAYNYSSNKIKIKNNYLYIDADHSFLYNVFRFSTRQKVPLSIESIKEYRESSIEIENEQIQTEKKDPFDRENADTYTSWLFFFGWIKYIDSYSYKNKNKSEGVTLLGEKQIQQNTKIEHWKHFRILPLTWLSWNPETNKKVSFYFAAGLWYDDEIDGKPIKYTAIFPLFIPLYGYAQEDKDYTRFIFFNFYVENYTEEDKLLERSYFWPLSKFYYSEKESGSYIFPFYAYKRQKEEETERIRHFSLFHYYNKEINLNNDNLIEHSTFWLLLYWNKKEISNNEEKDFSIILPFFYISSTNIKSDKESVSWSYIFPIFYFYDKPDKNQNQKKFNLFPFWLSTVNGEEKELSILWPLSKFYYSEKESGSYIFPLYAYNKTIDKENRESSYLWILLYYHSIDTKIYRPETEKIQKDITEKNKNNKNKEIENQSENINIKQITYIDFITLFPVLYIGRDAYYNEKTNQFTTYTHSIYFLLLFNWFNKYNPKDDKSYTETIIFFPLLRLDFDDCDDISYNIIRYCKKYSSSTNTKYFRIFPLFWSFFDDNSIFFTILPLIWSEFSNNHKSFTIFPLIWSEFSSNNKFFVIFPIIGISYNCDFGHYFHFIYLCPKEGYYQAFPLFWYKRDRYLTLYPFIWYRKKDYFTIFPLLTMDWEDKKFNDMVIYPLLSGYKDKDHFNLFFYLLGHRNYNGPNNYSYNITPLFWVNKYNNNYTNVFLPFYYYSQTDYEENLYIYPTLGWRSKEGSRINHCQLLCILYYGKENSYENNDYFLLTLFQKFEDKSKDSYEIWALWRLLFWYEDNKQEDIKRFLILGTGIEKRMQKTYIRFLFFKF
ncbi:MAG: hypothetical protein KatS3mg129_1361 [Leptospiraceae bacterium]|nr:MAG: hypothetical protein KatS3mg129_1361 [Leptospiraceae bacterium]